MPPHRVCTRLPPRYEGILVMVAGVRNTLALMFGFARLAWHAIVHTCAGMRTPGTCRGPMCVDGVLQSPCLPVVGVAVVS